MAIPGLLERLKQRKLVQWTLAYMAGAWLVLQVAAVLASVFSWPPFVLRALTVLLATGVLVATIVAWYHGESGTQKVGAVEVTMLAGILVIAGVAMRMVRGEASASHAGAPAELAAAANANPPTHASIAVLPFADLSAQRNQAHWSDGLAEELLDALGQVEGLNVAARTSSFSFKGQNVSLDSIGRALRVAHVLEGGVRTDGDRLRVTVRLVSTGEGNRVLWSESYDRQVVAVLQVQDEIARSVVRALQIELAEGPGVRTLGNDPDGYVLYLQGLAALNLRNMNRAIAQLEEAVERDPALARAHAALAYAHAVRPYHDFSVRPRASEQAGYAAVERALRMDSTLADAHMVLGVLRIHYAWDYLAGERDLRKAIALNPSFADAYRWLAQLYAYTGRDQEAVEAIYRAVEVDPLNSQMLCNVPRILAHVRRAAAAVEAISPEHCGEDWSAYLHIMAGRYADAQRILQAAIDASTDSANSLQESRRVARMREMSAVVAARLGGQSLRPDQLSREDERPGDLFFAWAYAIVGDTEKAARAIQRLYDERHPHVLWITGPEFDSLRDNPRYRAILAELELPINE